MPDSFNSRRVIGEDCCSELKSGRARFDPAEAGKHTSELTIHQAQLVHTGSHRAAERSRPSVAQAGCLNRAPAVPEFS